MVSFLCDTHWSACKCRTSGEMCFLLKMSWSQMRGRAVVEKMWKSPLKSQVLHFNSVVCYKILFFTSLVFMLYSQPEFSSFYLLVIQTMIL